MNDVAENATRPLILKELRPICHCHTDCSVAMARRSPRIEISKPGSLMAFAEDVYALTRTFPREELFGLTSQIRRSAVAIPSNVAEGHRHGTNADSRREPRTEPRTPRIRIPAVAPVNW